MKCLFIFFIVLGLFGTKRGLYILQKIEDIFDELWIT